MEKYAFEAFRDRVKASLRLEDVVAAAGVELKRCGSQLRGRSPFNDDRTPSFYVHPVKQLWHDYSGGGSGGGDVFEFIMRQRGCTFFDALLEGAQVAGVERPDADDPAVRAALDRHLQLRDLRRLLTAAATYYHQRLPVEIREQYFHKQYGFTDETIDAEQRLGWADGTLRSHFIGDLKLDRVQCLATGLFVEVGGNLVDFFLNRLVFPYWKDGQVANFAARRTHLTRDVPYEEAKYKRLPKRSDKHPHVSPLLDHVPFYGEDHAWRADTLVITEGQPDCVSAIQAGFDAIAPGTTKFSHDDLPRLIELTERAKKIVLCNDNEQSRAGDQGAQLTAAALWKAGRPVFVATLPRRPDQEKVDVNDLAREQGAEALQQVIAEAAWWPDYLIAQVPPDARGPALEHALAPVITAAAEANDLHRGQIVEALSKRTGQGKRALQGLVKDAARLRDRQRAADERGRRDPPAGRRPRAQIQTNDRQEHAIVLETRHVLAATNARNIDTTLAGGLPEPMPVFVNSGRLVALDHNGIELKEQSEAKVHGALIRAADWIEVRYDKEGEASITASTPPLHVVRDMLAYPPPELPQVDTVLATPTFAGDGTLIRTPGVHASAGVWMTPKCLELTAIPEQPSPDEVAAAKALLLDELLIDFPFATEADRTHFLAAMLLPFARRLIDGNTPLHLIEAPTQGTGKGLLVEILFQIATGAAADVRTLPANEEEARKAITSELLRGKPLIVLDNADDRGVIHSVQLATVLTAESWSDRLLGTNDVAGIRNQATWIMTANNPRLSKDLMRRSIRIRIDAKRTDPWRRSGFRHNPLLTWVKEERARLVAALVTIIQAWLAAGRPLAQKDLGAFPHWALTMGGILEHANVPGFLENLDALYARSDSEGGDLAAFVAAWASDYGDRSVTTKELVALCERHDLLVAQRGDGGERSQQSKLGRLLHRILDTCVDDWQLVAGEPNLHDRKTRYALKRLLTADAAGEPAPIDPWTD